MKKAEKYYTNKEQTRNTEVQINEEETGKLPEDEFISKRNAVILILWKLANSFKLNIALPSEPPGKLQSYHII